MKDWKSLIDDFTSGFNQTVEYEDVGVTQTVISHRYRSWEYCRKAFLKYKDHGLPADRESGEMVVDNLALQLAFYLASWGMYRGSSFLLRFDYKIHEPIVKWLLSKEYRELFKETLYETEKEKYLKLLFGDKEFVGIVTKLKDYFMLCREAVNEAPYSNVLQEKNDNISDTLITKILMGAYGCIPAYDRYFMGGLRSYNIQQKFNRKGVERLLDSIDAGDKEEIKKAVIQLNNKYESVYTPMKVVDMYFWGKGKLIDVYPFNVIKSIFGEQKKITGNKKTLTKMIDEAFEKLKEMPDEADMEDFEEFELVLSKSISMAESFYKYGKSVAEIAEEIGVSETVVRNGLAKVMRKLRHLQISKPIRQNIVVEGE